VLKFIFTVLLLLSYPVYSDLYIIQSKNVSDLYGTSIGNAIKRERPEWTVSSLSLRDFSLDNYSQSDVLVAEGLKDRVNSFSNLVVLGRDLSDLGFQNNHNYTHIPYVIGIRNKGAATPSAIMEVSSLVREHVSRIRPQYYLISDTSDFSQRRLREFARISKEKGVDFKTYDVSRATELRAALLEINSEKYSGVIINNAFRIVDGDSFSVIYSEQIDSIITRINSKHVEIGTLRSNQTLAVGVGIGTESIASVILEAIDGNPTSALPAEIGINLSRVSQLNLTQFVLFEGNKISYVETSR